VPNSGGSSTLRERSAIPSELLKVPTQGGQKVRFSHAHAHVTAPAERVVGVVLLVVVCFLERVLTGMMHLRQRSGECCRRQGQQCDREAVSAQTVDRAVCREAARGSHTCCCLVIVVVQIQTERSQFELERI
jgi:hypothetical protein